MKIASAFSWSPAAYASKAGPTFWKNACGPRQREERRLQENESVHDLGTVQRHLQGDGAAAGVAGDVRPRHIEVLEQRRRVNHVIGDAHRRRGVRAPGPAALVVSDEAVAVRERAFGQERQKAVCQHRADEQDRLAGSLDFVLQLHAIDGCFLHTRAA